MAYNYLFSLWLARTYELASLLQVGDVRELLKVVHPPRLHQAISEAKVLETNVIATASLASTINALLLGRPSVYEELAGDLRYRVRQQYNSYHPRLATKKVAEEGVEGLLESVISLMAVKDASWMMLRRPATAPGEERESYLRRYILLREVNQAAIPFFQALFGRLREKLLADDLAYEETVEHVATACQVWEETHPGCAFYPPDWPPELGRCGSGGD